MNTQTVDLREELPRGQALSEAVVDRDSNRISGVALLGRVSRNNREYTDSALEDAARLYRGTKAFLDHPTARELKERKGVRSVRDLVGRIENPRRRGDRVLGDLSVLGTEPVKSLIFALAEVMPDLVGFSHRAQGKARVREDGVQVVESLDAVHALEIVSEPATTSGLLESIQANESRDESAQERHLEEAMTFGIMPR